MIVIIQLCLSRQQAFNLWPFGKKYFDI